MSSTPANTTAESKIAEVASPAVRTESDRTATSQARSRKSNFGGLRLKLSVNAEIPGFHLYWENDDGEGAIEQLLDDGFDFVTPEEVGMKSRYSESVVADSELTNRVSRFVGKTEQGLPMRAFLLKCPNDVWAERESERHAMADERDADIRRRARGEQAGEYALKDRKTNVDTSYRKEF